MTERTDDQKTLLEVAADANSSLKKAYETITERFVEHKLSLLKDYNNLAVLVLGGAITLLSIAPNYIKTIWLFYIASIFLVALIIMGFIVQVSLFNSEEKLLCNIGEYGQKISNEITDCKRNPDNNDYFIKLDKTLQDSFKPFLPKNWLTLYGQSIAFILFILGLLGLAISLIAKITL